jgi:hypothetical protein
MVENAQYVDWYNLYIPIKISITQGEIASKQHSKTSSLALSVILTQK